MQSVHGVTHGLAHGPLEAEKPAQSCHSVFQWCHCTTAGQQGYTGLTACLTHTMFNVGAP